MMALIHTRYFHFLVLKFESIWRNANIGLIIHAYKFLFVVVLLDIEDDVKVS